MYGAKCFKPTELSYGYYYLYYFGKVNSTQLLLILMFNQLQLRNTMIGRSSAHQDNGNA